MCTVHLKPRWQTSKFLSLPIRSTCWKFVHNKQHLYCRQLCCTCSNILVHQNNLRDDWYQLITNIKINQACMLVASMWVQVAVAPCNYKSKVLPNHGTTMHLTRLRTYQGLWNLLYAIQEVTRNVTYQSCSDTLQSWWIMFVVSVSQFLFKTFCKPLYFIYKNTIMHSCDIKTATHWNGQCPLQTVVPYTHTGIYEFNTGVNSSNTAIHQTPLLQQTRST